MGVLKLHHQSNGPMDSASWKCELGCSGDNWSTSMGGRCSLSMAHRGLQVLSSVHQLQLPGSIGEEDTVLWAQFVPHMMPRRCESFSARPLRLSGKKAVSDVALFRCSLLLRSDAVKPHPELSVL